MIILQQLGYNPEILKYYHLSGKVVSYFVLALAIFAIFNYKKFQSCYRWLFINILLSAILELLGLFLVEIGAKNTLFVSHVYLFQETITLGLFYIYAFQNIKIQTWAKYIIIVFSSIVFLNAIWDKGYLTNPSKFALVENFIFVLFSLLMFRQFSLNAKAGYYRKTPLYWFNLYVFTTFLSIMLFFLVIDSVLEMSDDIAMILYIIKNSITLIFYTFWILGTIKLPKPTATPKPSQQPLERN